MKEFIKFGIFLAVYISVTFFFLKAVIPANAAIKFERSKPPLTIDQCDEHLTKARGGGNNRAQIAIACFMSHMVDRP